jgi:two-component system, chemotaxis family, CheB/CheR fusion protein
MDSTDQPPRSAGADGAGTASTSETATTQRADADERSQVASAPERPVGVVGIGASAGGIEAVSRLLAHTPIDTGLAFVVVIHLSPDHESQLAELLQRHTEMPVEQVRDDVTGLAPNAVYVIPPGRNLTSVDSHLRLSELEPAPLKRAPIDHFFRTLAATNDGASIGVVLSGTGSDGSMGLRSIKEHGGLTIVQEPSDAQFDGMPQTALATGMVDMVLSVEAMPRAFVGFAETRPVVTRAEHEAASARIDQYLLRDIVGVVRDRTGRDFGQYKRATLLRRIGRRMQIHGLPELEAYRALVHRDPTEAVALGDEFLINVTEFFRDPDVFDELERSIVPQLFHGKGSDGAVRVWSVGCSTGEEAYSLALLLHEHAATLASPPTIQLFASDLHQESLRRAREGRYPETISAHVSEERLQRFFDYDHGTYVIKPQVRESIVFAPHNAIVDAPFSQLDLVVCRNLLIYLERPVQRELVNVFHYALGRSGFLLLGPSESIDDAEIFVQANKSCGIYRKRNGPQRRLPMPHFPLATTGRAREREAPPPKRGFAQLHHEILERHGPGTLLLDPSLNVVHLSERAGKFLRHPGGPLTGDVFRIVRNELRLDLRAAMHEASKSGSPTSSPPVEVDVGDAAPLLVVIEVSPTKDPRHEGFSLVTFHEVDAATLELGRHVDEEGEGVSLARLEAELERERQRLRTVLEEQAESEEGLRVSNEELMSVNEELRVTMEELETSREELQSVNEELLSLNAENRHKVEELTRLSNDLTMLMTSADIAMLFLDREFRIVRFTPRLSELFNVRHSDRGRPLSDLTHRFGDLAILGDAERVMERLEGVTRELQREDGRWFLTRMLPYRSHDDRVEGVVVTFVDISEQKEVEARLQEAYVQLERVMGDLRGVNEELAAFNYSVSHDLRGPLREILHAARVAADRAEGDDALLERMDRIRGRAVDIRDIIDGLMALSSAGREQLEWERVDLGGIAEGVVRTLRERDPERSVDVTIGGDLIAIGDRRLLKTLMVNLIENAWKYTSTRSHGRIEVGRQPSERSSTFSVRDNGVGFDMSLTDRLFIPFSRLHDRATFPGAGIGLALARRIVRRHGGTISATSGPDEGTTFVFTLPHTVGDGRAS